MYITICKIADQLQVQWDEAGHSKLVLWDKPEGWGTEGGERVVQDGGTHVYLWLIHVDVWGKPSQYCKVTILYITILQSKYPPVKTDTFFFKKKNLSANAGDMGSVSGLGRSCLAQSNSA